MKIWCALLLTMLVTACGDQYRYPCQDPANWNRDICKKPLCDINRTCPEHIFRGMDITRMFPPGADVPEGLKSAPGSTTGTVPPPAAPRAGPKPPTPPATGACK
jgi:hypothetical protein